MPKLYDCFMFSNEVDMAELRMSILDPVVDHFVIAEANETHSGNPKPYNFDANLARFSRWSDKIIYVQIDNLTGQGRNSWEREKYHRTMLSAGLISSVRNEDWVLVGDCDEIADPYTLRLIKEYTTYDAAKLEMDFYYYNVHTRVNQGWAIGMCRWEREKDPNKIRTCSWTNATMATHLHAGWHFSYFMRPDQIVEKLNSFMHHADPGVADVPRDSGYVASRVAMGQDIFNNRGIAFEQIGDRYISTLPAYLLENREHYAELGWISHD